MATIIDLPRGADIFVSEFSVPPGRKRRRWNVVRVEPDGSRDVLPFLAKDREGAEWFCNIMRENEAKRRETQRMIDSDPFFRMLSDLSDEMRRAALYVLENAPMVRR